MKVGYVRVSTKEQNIARQAVLMEQLGVDKVFIEKCSGKDKSRPELDKLLAFVREGDRVVVESYSRFARNTMDLLTLVNELGCQGVEFYSQKEQFDSGTPQGRLMLTMFAALSQFERECLLERQAEGIAIAKAEGRMTGRPRKAISEFPKVYEEVKAGKLSASQGARDLGISRSSWYRKAKEFESGDYVIDLG